MMRYRVDKKTGIIQKIITMDEGIAAADKIMRGWTETELEGLAAIAKDKFEFDAREELWEMKQAARAEGRVEGHAEGHAEGRVEGHAEAMKDTARKLKVMGIPMNQITEVSGLSAEAVEYL